MNFTETSISKLQSRETRYDIPDDKVRSLYLRIEPSGVKTWYVYYRHPVTRHRIRKKIAPQEQLTVAQAREYAKNYTATAIVTKMDPTEAEKTLRARLTLKELIDLYIPWMKLHRKSVRQSQVMMMSFDTLHPLVAEEISSAHLTQWKQTCKNRKTGDNLNPKTINRRIALLKGMYSWAVREGHIKTNPLKNNVEMLKEDDDDGGGGRVRYLRPDERKKLLAALDERDREEGDYLKTAVLVSLNTGVRRGTLLRLKWEYIDWPAKTLILPAKIMKGGRTKKIPLNSVALEALKRWKKRSVPQNPAGYIFPGNTRDEHLDNVRTHWKNLLTRAGIDHFRWHDMRHDFGSQLAMNRVDILTIKELLCHENLKMTLVYAHLAPQHLSSAVEGLSKLYNGQ